jgi:transcriptional regulator GlxA family with amidase domain
VDTGRVLSSAGIAAGLDLSLHLVRRCAGVELAQRTARQLDYPWDPTE